MHADYDPAAHLTTRLLRYDKWQDGTLRNTELQNLRLQRCDIDEFENLLAQAASPASAGYDNARTAGPGGRRGRGRRVR